MELLIRLIIYLIEQAGKPKEEIGSSKAQQLARQKALQAQRAEQVRRALEAQQARARPVAARPKAGAKQVQPRMPTAWSQPAAQWSAPVVAPVTKGVAAVVPADASKKPARPGWQIPLLMGEILGPPAALREPEF